MNAPTPQVVRARVFVSGKVQGVGYRFSTCMEASRQGVRGWVKNLRDGRVEAVFEGDRASVEAMVRWCREGSPAARVDGVETTYEEPAGIQGFQTLY